MLDELIKGVKQAFSNRMGPKKADWPWKNGCVTVL